MVAGRGRVQDAVRDGDVVTGDDSDGVDVSFMCADNRQ